MDNRTIFLTFAQEWSCYPSSCKISAASFLLQGFPFVRTRGIGIPRYAVHPQSRSSYIRCEFPIAGVSVRADTRNWNSTLRRTHAKHPGSARGPIRFLCDLLLHPIIWAMSWLPVNHSRCSLFCFAKLSFHFVPRRFFSRIR
jgi:hypothetical protein